MSFDTIIRNGRWFDGTGAPSAVRNIGIRSGHVVAISPEPLDETDCPQVIDATDKWVMPGMLDIHTHYDVEVLAGPSLSESLRHGVTTVMLGSCSLSTVHVGGVDAGDLFGRVEAIPRGHVIDVVDSHKTWTDCNGYVTALESLPLGPNLAAFIGHSDMRTAVMGLDRATRKDERPTAAEQARMEQMLAEALDAGFVGMSSQQLLFDKIDGDTCRSRTLPSTYAKPRELRRLKSLLRRSGRVLQSGPDIQNPFNLVSQLAQSLGLFRSNLKTSLLSAADIKANPYSIAIMGPVARLVNKLGGNFRWQHLPVPFEVYADGIDLVVFEEFGSGAAALHLRDELERNELLRDEEYRRKFRKDYDNKFGVRVWHRDFFDAEIVACPDESVVGKSFGQVGQERGELHPVDAFLDLVLEHGTALRWRTTISNHRPEVLKKLARDPGIQLGFSDAGAHLRNMAFYNMGLRLLRHVRDAERAGAPFMSIEQAVHRLTGELADWYRIDAGHLRIGDRADVAIIDPEHLDDSLDAYAEDSVEQYGGLSRMVNRNDQTVTAVLVGGRTVFTDGQLTDLVGKQRTGRFLRAAHQTPSISAENSELISVR
ncbi:MULTISPECIES: N-acyl-D-amino-acid deacylase family protein [Mycolicibacterium]|uniref:N-acyl-D-aspartate/D-glutamate deacylase n=1 Tax=Mycolicibacterium senegalense TaxID=1796 RepID=A0A378T0Q9_9MYCO|nr:MULTISPECIES: amidohydrolase family protein [Mycolicibacterium]MCV7338376.1 amidohydrolase family protein [Mycolicibacterium senegalense]MDR7290245.1 N-acyl-D-aspartate/D-glutamate deacylase [Mycolicibacterium senegalense]QZA26978.1 amidohydrolase family protein [Mycolicibacterium senegalense]CDP82029.1 N-acyl-D-aspartate/D-glutamate deacylase [Mycolicibacterium farcinogenes]STZ54402.1 N-acyl-D-aspartate/D-glutamate deacylase [Mycolicibacterium senegalense]